MSDYNSRVAKAIQTLQLASEMSLKYYHKPLIICYSGGKDSDVLLDLAKKAEIPFEVQNSHTTVDAPETVYHIREVFEQFGEKERITTENGQRADVYGGVATIIYPKKTMWDLIATRKIPPTRTIRYCCSELKEASTPNRMAATGVRKAESVKRRSWNAFELRTTQREKRIHKTLDDMREAFDDALQIQNDLGQTDNETNAYDCIFIEKAKQGKSTVCNPIINLTDEDVWQYINEYRLKICDLYFKGYKRCGCIGCPMGTYKSRVKEFSDYPTYERAYKRTFKKMLQEKLTDENKRNWENEQDVFDWWIENPNIKGQISIDEYIKRESIGKITI